MSELDLPALAASEKARAREELKAPLREIDAALKACTFGRFHIRLLVIAFCGLMAGIFTTTSTAFLLPSAECDLKMNLLQKGLLNGMPYMGMLLSSVVAGFLTDAFGRKIFLWAGFAGMFLCALVAGSSQTFEILVFAKFLDGILFATSFSASVTLTAEFCYSDIRDRMMICQSSSAAVAHVLIAGLSWAILTNEWRYSLFDGKIVLNTWNFYLYIMSLWPLLAAVMYVAFIPESPKYFLTQRKYNEAREILIRIYKENTGKPAETYPYYDIWKDKTSMHSIDEKPENEVKMSIRQQIGSALYNMKPLFRKPLGVQLVMICFCNFMVMALYNVLRLWFPQVSAIVENNPLQDGQDMCFVLDQYTESLKVAASTTTNFTSVEEVCVQMKSGNETYINAIILGCVCLVPYFITGILVNKVGKKAIFLSCGLMVTATSLGLRWAANKIAIVALFSVSVSISQTMMSLNQALTVEFFPTTSRTMAISLVMVIGRMGTTFGNIAFPALLNIGCTIPFFTLSGCMILVIIVATLLPNKKK